MLVQLTEHPGGLVRKIPALSQTSQLVQALALFYNLWSPAACHSLNPEAARKAKPIWYAKCYLATLPCPRRQQCWVCCFPFGNIINLWYPKWWEEQNSSLNGNKFSYFCLNSANSWLDRRQEAGEFSSLSGKWAQSKVNFPWWNSSPMFWWLCMEDRPEGLWNGHLEGKMSSSWSAAGVRQKPQSCHLVPVL